MTETQPAPKREAVALAYGFRSDAWAIAVFKSCLQAGFVPVLIFTVGGRRGRYICAENAAGARLYMRAVGHRFSDFDFSTRPDFFRSTLRRDADRSKRFHLADGLRSPLQLRLTCLQ
jgi:hypothetical protein